MFSNRNLGKFTLPACEVKARPEMVAEVFALLKVVPVRCEYLFCSDTLEYTAISPQFPEVPHGELIPEYIFGITQSDAGNVELVEVIRRKGNG